VRGKLQSEGQFRPLIGWREMRESRTACQSFWMAKRKQSTSFPSSSFSRSRRVCAGEPGR